MTMKTQSYTNPEESAARIIPIHEAAERLAATPRTVLSLMQQGALDRVVLPGRRRARGVTAASLERLIAEGTNQAGIKAQGGVQ